MNKRVLKWPLKMTDLPQEIGSGPIALVDIQNQQVVVWTVEPSEGHDLPVRSVVIVGTGHTVSDAAVHLGSVQIGMYVWHVFDVTDAPAVQP